MKARFLKVMPYVGLLFLMGCGGSNVQSRSIKTVLRPATDVPAAFEAPEGISLSADSCKNPLIDPRDGTRIIMQSSFAKEGVGNYEVPAGKYGVKHGELLRINCATGEVLGIVKR